MPSQTTLDLSLPLTQTFDNYIVGENSEVLKALKNTPKLVWLSGAQGTGKTHLLRSVAHAAAGTGRTATFVAASGRPVALLREDLELAAQFGDVVVIDDLQHCQGDAVMEGALLACYERIKAARGDLVLCHSVAASGLSFSLPDLNSRLRSLLHYGLAPLSDGGKAELLRARAAHHGYDLSDAVIDYWLARGPRSIGALLTDLGRLDRASLSRHRQVTIPLLKEELGY